MFSDLVTWRTERPRRCFWPIQTHRKRSLGRHWPKSGLPECRSRRRHKSTSSPTDEALHYSIMYDLVYICHRFIVDLLWICCTAWYTTNHQHIEQVEFVINTAKNCRTQCSGTCANVSACGSLIMVKQEDPLTLRGQRGRCRNIKGEPQIYESFPNPRPCSLFIWVWFYGGPWQTQAVCQNWSP